MNSVMPDSSPTLDDEEDYFPWDCDGGDEDLGNYDEDGDE
jgi:hypothetical protein